MVAPGHGGPIGTSETATVRIAQVARTGLKLSWRPLVVSAGMPRSGSTLLFNLLREILTVKWQSGLSYGWRDDLLTLPRGTAYLIKTHDLSWKWRWRAAYSFYTYRDVRVAAVSALRKFDREITLGSVRDAIGGYEIAKHACNLCIKYEELIRAPERFARELARILRIEVDANRICSAVLSLAPPTDVGTYSKVTQLHAGHCTHTDADDWRTIIPPNLQRRISSEFAWWFSECGYPVQ